MNRKCEKSRCPWMSRNRVSLLQWMTSRAATCLVVALLTHGAHTWPVFASHPHAAPRVTSLTDPHVKFRLAESHHVVLRRGPSRVVIVDNHAVTASEAGLGADHRAGYNGVAEWTHTSRAKNIFRSPYAGLNYEHIHDGTYAVAREKFEPRVDPMQLRIVDKHTVELYQPPTRNWKLESCGRYRLLEDGTVEYTFECIPRARTFRQGYIGLFWASYIDRPEDKAIHFHGRRRTTDQPADWVRWLPPSHGVHSTHAPPGACLPSVVTGFPLTLVDHPSPFIYTRPWYYGVSHGMALAQVFRMPDRIWMAQSPTGGGATNPAWDFQWFVPDYRVGEAYGFVMRAAYLPYKSRKQLVNDVERHVDVLNRSLSRGRRSGSRSR